MFPHELTQLAAALTYYTVLSLLPALIVIVALLGMVGLAARHRARAARDRGRTAGAAGGPTSSPGVLDSVLTSQNSGVVFIVSLVTGALGRIGLRRSFMAGLF